LTIDAAFVSNGGTLESTASGGLAIDADVSNTKTIAALGSGDIVNHLISGNGTAFASGPHAEIDLAGAIFFGGTLKTRQRRQNCHQRQLLQRSHDRRKLIRGNPERRYARAAGDDDRRWSNRRSR
jgi:hypothetical protein